MNITRYNITYLDLDLYLEDKDKGRPSSYNLNKIVDLNEYNGYI